MKRLLVVLGFASALLLVAASLAVADDPGGHPHGPPPEAFAACQSLAAGDTCGFTMGDRAVTGTCRTGPGGEGALACAPAHRGPPPEAFAACQSLAEGATCTVSFHGQQVAGTCRTGPQGNELLACAPPRPPAQ
jgi:hypothetical protein